MCPKAFEHGTNGRYIYQARCAYEIMVETVLWRIQVALTIQMINVDEVQYQRIRIFMNSSFPQSPLAVIF